VNQQRRDIVDATTQVRGLDQLRANRLLRLFLRDDGGNVRVIQHAAQAVGAEQVTVVRLSCGSQHVHIDVGAGTNRAVQHARERMALRFAFAQLTAVHQLLRGGMIMGELFE
jgi:hypothetical protein